MMFQENAVLPSSGDCCYTDRFFFKFNSNCWDQTWDFFSTGLVSGSLVYWVIINLVFKGIVINLNWYRWSECTQIKQGLQTVTTNHLNIRVGLITGILCTPDACQTMYSAQHSAVKPLFTVFFFVEKCILSLKCRNKSLKWGNLTLRLLMWDYWNLARP